MATLNEGRHAGEFIGELAMGIGYHTETVTVLSGQNLVAGAVVGKQTSGGKYVAYDNAGTDDGRRAVAGILFDNVNASGADAVGVVMVRGPAIVNKNDLVWAAGIDAAEQAAAITALMALGIKAV
ncbi:MAG: head decoration protein [Blastomonas fulva]|uniref:head decoration protein n=1 Tax=Blastomonas fulva TaxID=1550728 RepID=UPI004033FE03